jgi:tetratricopeptide (TPR) repeat protein
MKRYFPIPLLLLAAIFFSTTGFQCGSAEITSAKLYIQQKQWDKAEQSLQKELSKNDNNEEAWYLLGATRFELRKYTGMNEAYTRALALGDAHKAEITRTRLAVWGTLYNEGVSAYNRGKDHASAYDTAIANYNTAIAIMPDSSTTYYVAALAYFAKNDQETAKAKLETALQKNPNFTDASRFLGQLTYMGAIKKQEAKDSVGAVVEFGKAAKAFEMTYKSNPSDAETIASLIDAYERSKQPDKALALTSDAVKKDPNNKVFRYAYGVFLLKQDKFQESIDQFTKAVEIDPNYTDATYNLGVAYLNWGVSMKVEADKKSEEASKAGKQAKEDKSYQEKFKQAIPYLEKAAQVRSDDAALWQQLGKVYANLNMVDKSKAAFEKFDQIMKGK